MVKFAADVNGRTLLGFGITAGNVKRLKEGKPIHVNLEEMGIPHKIDLMIMYGDDEQSIATELQDIGAIGPETKVNITKRSVS